MAQRQKRRLRFKFLDIEQLCETQPRVYQQAMSPLSRAITHASLAPARYHHS
jgi:hypothetical protein